jgi:hypothetical protein
VDYALRVHERLQAGDCYYDAKSGLRSTSSVGQTAAVPKKNVAISDVRFQNEITAIRRAGGKLIRLLRGTGLEGAAGKHRSETEILEIPDSEFDAIVDNNGMTLPQFEERVRQLAGSLLR